MTEREKYMNRYRVTTFNQPSYENQKFNLEKGIFKIMQMISEYYTECIPSECKYKYEERDNPSSNVPHAFLIEDGCGNGRVYTNVFCLMFDLGQNLEIIMREAYRPILEPEKRCTDTVYRITIRAIWFADRKPDNIHMWENSYCIYEDDEWPYYFKAPDEEVYSVYIDRDANKCDDDKKFWLARVESIAEIIDTTKEG